MANAKSKKEIWAFWLQILAWVACVLPTLIVGIIKFPMIATKDAESTLSGTFVLVLLISIFPIFKGLSVLFKNPSIAVFMWIAYAVLWLIYQFVAETLLALMSVCLAAAIGNTIGSILFFIANILEGKEKEGDSV